MSCSHSRSHAVPSESGTLRACNGCGEVVDVGEATCSRWPLADAAVALLSSGQSDDFVGQVREMIDTRSEEQLLLLRLR